MVDVSSWFCFVVVGLVCACVIHPLHLTLPTSGRIATILLPTRLRGISFTLNDVSAPPIGVVLLRLFDVLPLGDLVTCLVSVGGVKPWQVLLIFFTLAYASISVDVTGFSKYVALRTLRTFHERRPSGDVVGVNGVVVPCPDVNLSGACLQRDANMPPSSSPPTPTRSSPPPTTTTNSLLLVVYLLSGVLALIASNDVVVLTLTPVLIHFCRSNRIDPIPVLLVEYYAANTWSAFLEIGNPTNIILGQGLEISFVDYLKVSVIPTAVTILSSMGFVAMMPAPSPTQVGVEQCCAPVPSIVHQELLTVAAGTKRTMSSSACVGGEEPLPHTSSTVPHPQPTASIGDDGIDMTTPPPMEVGPLDIIATAVDTSDVSLDAEVELADPFGAKFGSGVLAVGIFLLCLSSYMPSIPLAAVTTAMCAVLCVRDFTILSTDPQEFLLGISRIRQVGRRMPWGVAPYAICMFILVDALERNHWIDTLADSFVSLCRQGGPAVASTTMMGITVLVVNLLNNQPAAILLSSALVKTRNILLLDTSYIPAASVVNNTSPPSSSVVDTTQPPHRNDTDYAKEEFSGIVSSVALGANIGACFTVAGALAGFMWLAILREHRLDVPWVSFAVAGAKFMIIPAVLGGIASGLQSWVGLGI